MHGPINIGFFAPILEYMNPIDFGGGGVWCSFGWYLDIL